MDTALLSPLFCEKDLALPGRFATQAKVHKILAKASSAARAAAESYGLDATSQNCANVLQKKRQYLLSQDKHFHIEMRFWKYVWWKIVRGPSGVVFCEARDLGACHTLKHDGIQLVLPLWMYGRSW